MTSITSFYTCTKHISSGEYKQRERELSYLFAEVVAGIMRGVPSSYRDLPSPVLGKGSTSIMT